MDPSVPESFNHRTEILSTGRKYHFVDQIPAAYDPQTTLTLLCVHGFPDLWYGWRYQIGPWTEKGYRVIVPDMLGYGGTDKPVKTEDYSTKRVCDDLAALLDLLEIKKAVVLGHDWGSFIAGRFAVWHPERLLALVMFSVPYLAPAKEYVPLEEMVKYAPDLGYQLYFADDKSTQEIEANIRLFLPLLHRQPGGKLGFLKVNEMRKFVLGERKVDDLMADSLLDGKDLDYYVSQYDSMHGPLSYYRISKIRYEEEKAGNLPSRLSSDLPVLFVWGMEDATAKAMQGGPKQAGKSIDKFQDLALEGRGHWLMVEPEARDIVTSKVVNWLKELGL